MITADQLLCHAIGDYIIQNDWMASNKTKNSYAAWAHAVSYGLPFLFLHVSSISLALIVVTHFIIDRWRLARHFIWFRNCMGPENPPWPQCSKTGFPPDKPEWFAVWLMIITDNVLHVLINGLVIALFPGGIRLF